MQTELSTLLEELVGQFDNTFFWFADTGENDSSVFYSQSIENVTGYSSNEVNSLPKKMENIIVEDDLPYYRKKFDELSNNKSISSLTLHYRIFCKDEKVKWLQENVKVSRNENGYIERCFGQVIDVTETKTENDELQRKIEELEQLNSSKDNFISVLSHDLRAPFTSILGFSEILMSESGISDKEKAEYLNYINDSSQNQLQLINYLLDWSRLQTGRLKLEPIRLHVQSIVYNCVSILTGQAVRKNINIKVNIPDTMYIDADERLVTLLFDNVISNGIKYSNEGTLVEVTANIYNDNLVEFVVKDEGMGISEENKEKLFNIGSMFSTEGTKGEKGTGLGLSLAKQIAEKHGGNIWFYSQEGAGSEFHFTLPSSSNTILLVRSNTNGQDEIEKILKKRHAKYDVICANNGFEALGLVSSKMPSLIITDHDMPLMDGLLFSRTVRKENKYLRIPIIALLKPEMESIKHEYQAFGIKTLLEEPLDVNLLDEKIHSVLNSF
jgi:PAS domain S-box-containing protein